MRVANIVFPAFNAYDGKVATEIYISGCYRQCPNCHNPELLDFDFGLPLKLKVLKHLLQKTSFLSDVFAVLGGDLLCQDEAEAKEFSKYLRQVFKKKELWLFTGAEMEKIPDWVREIYDVIKTGRYIEELKCEGFPSSTNQKVWKKGVDY